MEMIELLVELFIDTTLDVLPIAAIIFGFQFLVIRKPIKNMKRVMIGMLYVLIGITLFLVGLEQALFPLGRLMAEQLTDPTFIVGAQKVAGLLGIHFCLRHRHEYHDCRAFIDCSCNQGE
jgi:hypothetical protein